MEDEKKLKDIFRDIRRLSWPIKTFLILIMLFCIFGVVVLFWATLIITLSSLAQFYKGYVESLGFNFRTPFGFFLLFFLLFIVLPSYLWWLYRRRINLYFVVALSIILFIIIFGICFVNESYISELPQDLQWQISEVEEHNKFQESQNCSITKLRCESSQGKKNFVIDDEIYCTFTTNENCSYKLGNISLVRFYLNNESQIREEIHTAPSQGYLNFRIEETLHQIVVYPNFYNSSGDKLSAYYLFISPYNKYSLGDYNQKESKERYDKIFLLSTIISIGLFSSIVAMNNLKQLLEKKSKEIAK